MFNRDNFLFISLIISRAYMRNLGLIRYHTSNTMLYFRGIIHVCTFLLALLTSLSFGLPTPGDDPSPARLESSSLKLRGAVQSKAGYLQPTSRSLSPRDWKIDYLDEGWALYFSAYQHYLKSDNAIATLAAFFDTVAERAASSWIHQAPLKSFSVEFGDFILEFKSNLVEIPWKFVAIFAQRMRASVQNGFTGCFEAILEHLVSGGTIYVKLRIFGNAAAAA